MGRTMMLGQVGLVFRGTRADTFHVTYVAGSHQLQLV